jgi:AcrR family transcriptional regulator
MARPREFDRQAALKVAMDLFWQRGYEGVSVADLTAAMKIAPPSLYAAFGSKAQLYREVLDAYQRRPGAVSLVALDDAGSVRENVSALLYSAANTATELSPPLGCMILNGMLACSRDNLELADLTVELRQDLIEALRRRFQRAIREDELTADFDADISARYFAAIIQGISVQAHDGARWPELVALIELALEMLSPIED